jgi:GTP-binding protein Era
VAIVGAPNAGKSQLLNSLTQSKVAAVSRKRHTTRTDVLGARTVGDTQIVFKDTPGFLRLENAKEERLDRDLIATAAAEMQHVDYSLLVVDSVRTLKENYRHALVQLMVGAINSRGRIEEYDDETSEETKDISEDVHEREEKSKFAIVLNKGRWEEAGYVHRFCQMALSWSQIILSSIQWIW